MPSCSKHIMSSCYCFLIDMNLGTVIYHYLIRVHSDVRAASLLGSTAISYQ